MEPILFGSDGRTAIYAAKDAESGKWCMVVGEKKSEFFDKVSSSSPRLTVRPDGKRVAFGARKDRELWWQAMSLEEPSSASTS